MEPERGSVPLRLRNAALSEGVEVLRLHRAGRLGLAETPNGLTPHAACENKAARLTL